MTDDGDLQSFPASYDSTSKIITVFTAALLALIALVTQSLLAVAMGLLIVSLSYAYSPRGYIVGHGSVVIQRLIGNVHISLQGVRELKTASSADLAGAMRLWGVGGLFGHFGLFRTSKLGNCWWYVTNRDNAIVLTTDRQAILISPDDVDGFLKTMRAAILLPQTGLNAAGDGVGRSIRASAQTAI